MEMKPLPLVLLALAAMSAAPLHARDAAPEVGKPLPEWSEGQLDIHHINTGRGDALFFVMPDGTTMMEDFSGKTAERPPFSLPSKPDASRPPGEWVARYVQRALPNGVNGIDYALISHFHGDHMGAIVEDSPTAKNGAYRLSGITQVAELLPIAKVIDRGWPGYDYPKPIENPTVDNYRKFLDWRIAHAGLKVERFRPGRNDQIALLHEAEKYPQFEIRNIYASGEVWSGTGDETHQVFPDPATLGKDELPDENKLSLVFRISYGKFDYYAGGDLSSVAEETTFDPPAWQDIEPVVARATGPVDVMKANHHGSWDANGIPFLAVLQPRVVVVTSRAEGHPAVNTWKRLTSTKVWPGERDIFVTNVGPATAQTTYNILDLARSSQGHVVVRVENGGASYRVFVLDDSSEGMKVRAVFGPYESN